MIPSENHTSRMAALMGRLRREMNGAVAESMQRAGVRGLLNYGVSLPTIRAIAEESGVDHSFARFLFRQQVRELRLAAATIANPQELSCEEVGEWIQGIDHTEILDEVAMRLLSRAAEPILIYLAEHWLVGEDPMACYTALMALNRTTYPAAVVLQGVNMALERFPQHLRVARAALAYCSFHPEAVSPQELPSNEAGEFVRREFMALFG